MPDVKNIGDKPGLIIVAGGPVDLREHIVRSLEKGGWEARHTATIEEAKTFAAAHSGWHVVIWSASES